MGKWIQKKLGDLGETYGGLTGKTKEDFGSGKPYIPYTNIFNNEIIDISDFDFVKVSKGEKQNRVKKGDVFFTTSSETIEEVGMTSVLSQDLQEVYLNSFCFGFRQKEQELVPEFLGYLLRENNNRRKISFNGQGSTRYNISKRQLLQNLTLKFPSSKKEQATIANVLSTVDKALKEIKELIAKYEKIKTGLMQDLLTKGIDENGNIRSEETHEFKDSPLGRIPMEWEVDRLGRMATFISGKAWSTSDLTEYGKKIIRISNLHKPNFPYWRYDGSYSEDMIVNTGDILFSWAGVASSIDCVQYKGEAALLNQHIYNLIFEDDESKMFAHRFINSYLPTLRKEIEGGAGQLHLTKGKIQGIEIPKLGTEEQRKINSRLNILEENISDLIAKNKKLTLQKKGLMQDLLTGKVSVESLMQNKATIV